LAQASSFLSRRARGCVRCLHLQAIGGEFGWAATMELTLSNAALPLHLAGLPPHSSIQNIFPSSVRPVACSNALRALPVLGSAMKSISASCCLTALWLRRRPRASRGVSLAANADFHELSAAQQSEVKPAVAKARVMSCSACGHRFLLSSGRRTVAGVAAGAVAVLFSGSRNGGASAEPLDDEVASDQTTFTGTLDRTEVNNSCVDCNGNGINPCPRCEGTGMMTMIVDRTKKTKCLECKESTGWRICGRCNGTGLTQKELKALRRDPKFVKINRRTVTKDLILNEEGRRTLKETMTTAISEARERRAAKAKAA